MSDLLIEIQEMLEKGMDIETISKVLNVPVYWVYDVKKTLDIEPEDYSPFLTMNS